MAVDAARVEVVEDLKNRFAYHPPTSDKVGYDHENTRELCYNLACDLTRMVPKGREQAIMLTKLEEVMMWANAGIARNQ